MVEVVPGARGVPGAATPATPPAARRRRRVVGHPGTPLWLPYALLALPFAVYAAFVLYPLATTVRLSFYEWNGLTTPSFVGLANYVDLFTGETFFRALLHNGQFLLFYTVAPVLLALVLTTLLTQDGTVRGLAFYRVGLFVPQVIPLVVVGVVWRWMYSPTNGIVNAARGLVGLDAVPFLGDAQLALPAVGLVATWVQYGFAMVLFLAGVQKIDPELYAAAAIDGAGRWAKLRYITLPELRGEIVVAITVSLIAAIRVFDLVFVMTRGGPARATTVVAFEIYQRAFQQREVGAAAAAAVVLIAILLVLSTLVLRLGRRTAAA